MIDDDDREIDDDELDRLVARSLVQKGELIPIEVDQVRAAEDDGVELEGELPESLRELGALGPSPKRLTQPADVHGPAVSQRVVSIDELRRARVEKAESRWSHLATFAIGAAVAAGVALFLRAPGPTAPQREQGGGPEPAASASSEPTVERVSIPAVRSCSSDCCAGSACASAKGELKACASGRTCLACSEVPDSKAAYRVRIANLVPTKLLDETPLAALDVCGRVLGGEWSCVPAYAEPKAVPDARAFSRLVSASDLASGLEIEVRPHGAKDVLGHWRDSVRLGPTVLCRGIGGLVTNDKDEHVGSLALVLEDPYFVELGRSADVDTLKKQRATLDFADVTPALVETTDQGARRFALVAGPFDPSTADKLRWSLLEKKQSATTVLGGDFVGTPSQLP